MVIGMVNVQTGPAQALGVELKQGAEVYLNRINAQGGVHGRQLKLVAYDDGYEPAKSIDYTRKLIEEDRAFLLFGYVGTPTSRVVLPIASRAGVPYVAPFTGAAFLRKSTQPYVLTVRAGYNLETEMMVRYLVDKKNIRRIGMLIQDDGYGSAGREGVQNALQARGLKLAAVAKYERNTVDVAEAVTTLKQANPEAVIMVGAYAPCAAFIKQARQSGFDPVFMNVSFVGTSALMNALGQEGEGVYISQVMPDPVTSDAPVVAQFRQDMAAAGHTQMTYGALEGYVDAVVLARVLEKAGPAVTRDGFMATAATLKAEDIGGLTLKFGAEDHQGLDNVYLTQVRNGQLVSIDTQP